MYFEKVALLSKSFYTDKIHDEIEDIIKQMYQNEEDAKHITRAIKSSPYLSTETIEIMNSYRQKLLDKNKALLKRFRILEKDLKDIQNR